MDAFYIQYKMTNLKANGMKLTDLAGCIAIFLIFSGLASADGTATIHGTAYEWDTLDPLNNTLIEVNSTPAQSFVAKHGRYSFELPNGTYLVTASYFEADQLLYYDEELITISDNGSYVVDMLLLPAYPNAIVVDDSLSKDTVSSVEAVIISLIVASVFLMGIFYSSRPGFRDRNVTGTKVNKITLPDDMAYPKGDLPGDEKGSQIQSDTMVCEDFPHEKEVVSGPLTYEHREILEIIRSNGGNMAQKELRKNLEYSEGKVSLMLIDLERRGCIRKVRQGRGNILFLEGHDR
jgi:uncharacterized membrane protein